VAQEYVYSQGLTKKEKFFDAIKTNLIFYFAILIFGIIFALFFIIKEEFSR
jgi:hypothetical protein